MSDVTPVSGFFALSSETSSLYSDPELLLTFTPVGALQEKAHLPQLSADLGMVQLLGRVMC